MTVRCSSIYPTQNLQHNSERYFTKVLSKVNFDVGAKLSNFLATGNLVSPTGLDLQQASGFTIIAEKLNWQRYISHFRCIHRGAFFAELKTTTVRKLLPEAWGKTQLAFRCCLAHFSVLEVSYVLYIPLMVRRVAYSITSPEPAELLQALLPYPTYPPFSLPME